MVSEGVAIWQSIFFLRADATPDRAASVGRYRLRELERGFPVNAHRAGIAYAQAVHFVGFLHQTAEQGISDIDRTSDKGV